MHRLNELAAQLTPEQVREVEDFAEFLLLRRSAPTDAHRRGGHLDAADIAAAAKLLDGLPLDKSPVDLQHEALAARARKD
jgi:hypothetical protein